MRRPFLLVFATAAALALLASPLLAGWRSEGPFLGTVVDVAFDPHRPGVVFAAAGSGGVFRSDDDGRTWRYVGKPETGAKIEWLEADPGTSGSLWLGVDQPGQPALWLSRDSGVTWEVLDRSYSGGELTTLHPVGYRIAFAPSKPAEIWVPSTNLHYRSKDGGKTFSDFRVPGQDAYAMAVDPANPLIVYAGGHGGDDSAHLSRSDDGGKNWKPVGKGLEPAVKELRVDPASPVTVYARSGFGKLFKSIDRGASFVTMPSPVSGTDDLWNFRIQPGTGHLWAATEAGLFVSKNGGASWDRADRDTGRYLIHSVAFDPREPRNVLAASSGAGVYRSADGGGRWSPSSNGLSAGWVKKIFASPRSPALFAQLGTGLFRRDAGGGWTELAAPFESDGDAVELDGIFFERSSPQALWAFDGGSAWRSADGGKTFAALERKEPSMRDLMKGNIESPEFKSLLQDPANPKILYAGSWSGRDGALPVFKTTDGGKTWKPSGAGLPEKAVALLRAEKSDAIFAVADQKLFKSGDGGASWQQAGGGLPAEDLRELAIDPSSPTRLFVATEKGLFRSTDNGATFAKVGSAVAHEDIEGLTIAPDGRVFASSWRGVFASGDNGATFKKMDGGPAHEDVRALAIAADGAGLRLWAGTAGGGVYSTEIP
jgi:photosystem II stability/assembly factor-like uncharacterized protein